MNANSKNGTTCPLMAKLWIFLADAIGVAILLAVAASPVLKEWLLVLFTGVPLAASFILLNSPSRKSERAAKPFARPVSERQIMISPRVPEWEPYNAE